jgi:chorismate mutase/prephenate dehydratase
MKKLRNQIDKIDSDILKLLAKRKGLAKLVREYKKEHDMPIRIPSREKIVFKTRAEWGKKLGLSSAHVRQLMVQIIAESRRNQK